MGTNTSAPDRTHDVPRPEAVLLHASLVLHAALDGDDDAVARLLTPLSDDDLNVLFIACQCLKEAISLEARRRVQDRWERGPHAD